MGRIMRRIGTGSATQRVELGGTNLESFVKLQSYTASKSITASGTAWLSFSDFSITTISGYTLVGVVGWHITGTTDCFIRSLNTKDSTDFVALTNTSTGARNATVQVNCLYIKTDKIVTS